MQNVKSELRYLLKLVHLQNDRLRHPPQWSHSLFLPLLGQRVPPPPSFDLGCCSHFRTVPSSADCPQFQIRCGGPSGHLFLTGPELTCLCLAESRQDELTMLSLSLHQPANAARGRVPSQAHQHRCAPWTTNHTVFLLSAISPCLSHLLILQPPRTLSKHSLSPST